LHFFRRKSRKLLRPPNSVQRIARAFFGLSAPPDPAAVERGQQLYVTNCGFCHGTNANGGNSGPDLCWSTSMISAFL
jgi:cytochrome c oxidase cbb3-type subunit III